MFRLRTGLCLYTEIIHYKKVGNVEFMSSYLTSISFLRVSMDELNYLTKDKNLL